MNRPLNLKVYAYDDNAIDSVTVPIAGGRTFTLYDDGAHNDDYLNDFIYGNVILPHFFIQILMLF